MAKVDALAEIEEALVEALSLCGACFGDGIAVMNGEDCRECRKTRRALTMLPRLREVVEAAKMLHNEGAPLRSPRLRAALAALEGGPDA